MPNYLPATLGQSYSEAIAQRYASAGGQVLLALEIWNDEFDEASRLVNDFRPLTATLEADAPRDAGSAVEFTPVQFRYTKQEQTAEQSSSGAPAAVAIEIDNVSRQLAELMLMAKESQSPTTCIEREYLRSDTSAPHVIPVTVVTLTNITLTVDTVRANLSFGDLTNRKYPPLTYTAERFPALAA